MQFKRPDGSDQCWNRSQTQPHASSPCNEQGMKIGPSQINLNNITRFMTVQSWPVPERDEVGEDDLHACSTVIIKVGICGRLFCKAKELDYIPHVYLSTWNIKFCLQNPWSIMILFRSKERLEGKVYLSQESFSHLLYSLQPWSWFIHGPVGSMTMCSQSSRTSPSRRTSPSHSPFFCSKLCGLPKLARPRFSTIKSSVQNSSHPCNMIAPTSEGWKAWRPQCRRGKWTQHRGLPSCQRFVAGQRLWEEEGSHSPRSPSPGQTFTI